MKKLPLFVFAIIVVSALISTTACGPSAAEKARLDSIRIADSIRRADSIFVADSLKAAQIAADSVNALLNKVDEVAASLHASFVVKLPDLRKVVYANEGMLDVPKTVTIMNVVTDEKKSIKLRGSDMLGAITSMKDKGDGKHVVVSVHCGGSGPFQTHYTIDADAENVTKVVED